MKTGILIFFLIVTQITTYAEQSGSLQIRSDPDLQVFIDDVFFGTTSQEDGGLILTTVPTGSHLLV